MTKYVFTTGGVVSSVGKGVFAASLGMLLEARGLKIAMMKMDPYINVDPGTMNPFEHGEVFVTDDGAETDLDLGHYERLTNAKLSQKSNTTTGDIYNSVIQKERRGEFLGKTVQVIPHITDEIKSRIRRLTDEDTDIDVAIIEIGGTVGDIEGQPFLEALRQFRLEVGPPNCCFAHVTLVPFIEAAGELKTKPTQHSVRALRDIGIQPNVIVCRTGHHIMAAEQRHKIAMFCDVTDDAIINAEDISPFYAIPLNFKKQKLDDTILRLLNIDAPEGDLNEWTAIVDRLCNLKKEVRIAAVGKYVGHDDAYKSINEAFVHAGVANDCKVALDWVDSEQFEGGDVDLAETLKPYDGILVGPGFGTRGIEGKILAVQYARENNIPFMGICLGLQMAVIELTRNKLGLKEANSTEINPETPDPVISLLSEQRGLKDMGGTMRLGAYRCDLKAGTKVHAAYQEDTIYERHRHRYEFNNAYRERLENEAGMIVCGTHPKGDHDLVETIELKDHPWFCASQFHPEFKSKPLKPQPLFRDFVAAALKHKS